MNLRDAELTHVGWERKKFKLEKPIHWIWMGVAGEGMITVDNFSGTILNDAELEFTKKSGRQTIEGKVFVKQTEHDLLCVGTLFDLKFSDAGGNGAIDICRIYKIDKEDEYNVYYFISGRNINES